LLLLGVLEVTTTVAVHKAPGDNPAIVMVLSAVLLEIELLNTVVLSESFITVTPTVTPAVGMVELILTMIGCEVPTTPKIFPAPGSTFTVTERATSVVGVTGGGVGGVGVGESPPLLQDKRKNGMAINRFLAFFIVDYKDSNFLKKSKNILKITKRLIYRPLPVKYRHLPVPNKNYLPTAGITGRLSFPNSLTL